MRDGAPFSGSYSYDDPERPCWDRDTVLEREYVYCREDGSYSRSQLKGRAKDGGKRFLTARRSQEKPGDEILDPDWPDGFYKLHGLTRFKKGAGDEPDIPYRLDELAAAMAARPDDLVFINEGEQDADTLWDLGFIATTNPNGALNWKSEFNARFAGRDIVVPVDNDDRGRERASKIFGGLQGIAKTVRVVELPDLPEHGDVTDWIEAGHTAEDLLQVVHSVAASELPQWAQPSFDNLEFDRLATLSRPEYDRQRKAAANRLGIGVRTLDLEVEARRSANRPPETGGTALAFEDIEVWPEAVEGIELIEEIVASLKKHVVFPSDDHVLAVALWAVHAHLLRHAEHSPRLHITAPTKGCGKTVLLNTVAALVPKPLRVEHITSAALFRVIEEHQPSLLIDEVDTFLKDNEEMRGLLNAGHQPDTQVLRCVGDRQEVRSFSVFAATALAGIGEIPPTIEDRSITIPLRRRSESDGTVERLRRTRKDLEALAKRIARWAADNHGRLVEDPIMPDELGDRAQDNWRLMIAIADVIGESMGEAARKTARALELERNHDDNDAGLMALADVHAIFADRSERLSSHHIVEAMTAMEDRPWPEWRRGKPLTQNSLARLLKPFGITTKQVKAFNGKGYERGPIADAFARYCAPKPGEEISDVEDPL